MMAPRKSLQSKHPLFASDALAQWRDGVSNKIGLFPHRQLWDVMAGSGVRAEADNDLFTQIQNRDGDGNRFALERQVKIPPLWEWRSRLPTFPSMALVSGLDPSSDLPLSQSILSLLQRGGQPPDFSPDAEKPRGGSRLPLDPRLLQRLYQPLTLGFQLPTALLQPGRLTYLALNLPVQLLHTSGRTHLPVPKRLNPGFELLLPLPQAGELTHQALELLNACLQSITALPRRPRLFLRRCRPPSVIFPADPTQGL